MNTDTITLYAWNAGNKNRDVDFQSNQRFDNATRENRGRNQHSARDFVVDFNQTYVWLITSTIVVPSQPYGHFKCWEPEGTGIFESGRYRRLSFRGAKYLCHVFVWLFHHPGQTINGDVSHLCSNERCCRPDHLFCENRETNISRRGCPGYLVSTDGHRTIIKICRHNPSCTKTTPYFREDFVTLNYE